MSKETSKENSFWKELPRRAFLGGLLLMAGVIIGNWIGGPIGKAKEAAGL